jgi:hypothetical protein
VKARPCDPCFNVGLGRQWDALHGDRAYHVRRGAIGCADVLALVLGSGELRLGCCPRLRPD